MPEACESNELLTTRPPGFSTGDAAKIAFDHYAIDVDASALWSERDQNFRLKASDGNQFVLKIANAGESPGVIDFQTRALEHIAKIDPGMPVPRTISTVNNEDYCLVADGNGREHMVRLITWLDGRIIKESETSPELLYRVGRMLARLGLALRDFSHPAASHHLIWDLKNAAELLDLLPHIDEPGLRSLLERTLTLFENQVLPVMDDFRHQIIHADLNCGNILVSQPPHEEVSGIIDFGDMVRTPLIMDLAIAAAYHLSEHGDPMDKAIEFIRGYHHTAALEPIEIEHLPVLMMARLCTSITVQMWRAKLYPENSEYLLIHNQQVRRQLKHASSFSPVGLSDRIREACQ